MSTWTKRDLPVLRWLHENPPENGALSTDASSESAHPNLADLSERDVHVSVETLEDAGFVSCSKKLPESGGGAFWTGFQVSGAGLQALGEWPVFEILETPGELGRLLEVLADMAPSDEEETNMRTAAKTVRSYGAEALQALVSGVVGGLVRAHTGL